MGLTLGAAPFGHTPGRFNFEPPAEVLYVEPVLVRVRGVKDGATVVDSNGVQLVHRSRTYPRWSFPAGDVQVPAEDDPDVPGNVQVPWDAVDEWFHEDEPLFLHFPNPYHRVDCYSTSRRVVVTAGGVVLADTTAAIALVETALPVRWYLPPDDVAMEHLERTETTSGCPYKGIASYWSATVGDSVIDDVAWAYLDPLRESERVRGHLCFYDDKVAVVVSDA